MRRCAGEESEPDSPKETQDSEPQKAPEAQDAATRIHGSAVGSLCLRALVCLIAIV